MTDENPLCTPWSLHFDRDGTEDFGIICDAEGNSIAASHLPCTRIGDRTFQAGTFWLPEKNDPIPVTLRQLRLMTAAPKLLDALRFLLADGNSQIDYEERLIAEAAIAEAEEPRPLSEADLPY